LKEIGQSLRELLEENIKKMQLVRIFDNQAKAERFLVEAKIIPAQTKNQLFLVGYLVKDFPTRTTDKEIEERIKKESSFKTSGKRLFKGGNVLVLNFWE